MDKTLNSHILNLEDLGKADTDICGGKAAALGKLARAGFNVPRGFVITAPAFGEGATITEELERAVRTAFTELGAKRVAVRSSAAVEDGPARAWAGQLESFLNTTEPDLAANIARCRASAFSPRVLAYRDAAAGPEEDVSVAVIVQEMVDAEVSGVAFSVHPLTGEDDCVVIEAARGLGEDLVSGRITPTSYPAPRSTSGAGTTSATSAGGDPAQPAGEEAAGLLSEKTVAELAQVVLEIEKSFGFPVDVEWAIAEGRISIVQARPITTIGRTRRLDPADSVSGFARPSALEADLSAGHTWSNLNIAEVLPGTVPPLVAEEIVKLIVPAIINTGFFKFDPSDQLIGLIRGRFYFNLTAFMNGLSGIMTMKTDDINITKLLGGRQNEADLVKAIPTSSKLKLAVFGLRILARSLLLSARMNRFVARMRALGDTSVRRSSELEDLGELLSYQNELSDYIEARALTAFQMVALPFTFFFLFSAVSEKWLSAFGPEAGRSMLARGGFGFQPVEALAELWAIRDELRKDPELAERFTRAGSTREALDVLEESQPARILFDAFLEKNGHRCALELNFAVPRWREDPSFLVQVLKKYIGAPETDSPLLKQEQAARRVADDSRKILSRLPQRKRAVLKPLAALAALGQRWRENMKSELVRLLFALRVNMLKIGEVLEKNGALERAEDIFMLSRDELAAAGRAGQGADLRAIADRRRAEYAAYAVDRPPDVVSKLSDLTAPPATDNAAASDDASGPATLSGIAVSRGIVEGTARLVKTIEDVGALQPGDILLTDHTDPGWTPLFTFISGVITNTGGLVSHTSIVAREYGLPAVVNLPNATELISDGQHVILDGDRGLVILK